MLSIDTEQSLLDIKKSIVIEPKKFIELAKASVAQEKSNVIVHLVSQLKNFPQFIPYILNIVCKYEYLFSDDEVQTITDKLNEWLIDGKASEFIMVYIVRFFGAGRFKNKSNLFEYFRKLRRNEGSYIGRAVLEQLEHLVGRGEVL